jgi:beta-1,4-mannosyl-glycoprotein beta-1,4-N-acetylglucosaminyltransferase
MKKNQHIVDVFPFFNELDVLELRLRVLADVADLHYVVQAMETHAGHPKPLYFNPEDDRWRPWRDKLRNIVLPPMNVPALASRWMREHQPRLIIASLLWQEPDETLVLMSDVDEIPNPLLIEQYAGQVTHRRWVGFRAACYYYYLNLRVPRPHKCIALARASRVRELGGQHFRDKAHRPPIGPIDGGWHFSYLGGVDAIITKLSSFAHAEFDTDALKDPAYLRCCVAERRSFFPSTVGGMQPEHHGIFTQVALRELPLEVFLHPERYQHHLLPPEER